jgi:hypothetical protein
MNVHCGTPAESIARHSRAYRANDVDAAPGLSAGRPYRYSKDRSIEVASSLRLKEL